MRVLVTVASRHGGTREIGARVAERLRARGHDAEVLDPESVDSIDAYDAVVIGSAVYSAHWMPSAREFAQRFAAELLTRPVWLFSSGLATAPAAAANSPAETLALIKAIDANGHRAFGGQLDRGVLNFAERAIIAAARGKEGDHRDMSAVDEWADQIADQLGQQTTTA
ncbi:flavodoxin domain-containing protein [Pengzhenrongella frigida]|uniref:Protoporphyrinogen oxidase n=1 Tax=Pengzhenrongella frigida TaxID=1259133 RepID=A0A4Q5N0X4_9MICO|nr:flavodoxin domain-containing protein [Cellulomonas sp. HLT2-17]RYV49661.1 protoporphyrinogen oxidase [Cellulomonas sp. HLT2-17]